MILHLMVLVVVAIIVFILLVALLTMQDIVPFSPQLIDRNKRLRQKVVYGRIYVNNPYCGVLVDPSSHTSQDTLAFYTYNPAVHNGYTILHSHCNRGDMVDNSHVLLFAERYGFNLIGYDYRGFGSSSQPTQLKNMKEDSWAMYRYALSVTREDKLILWGESLGSISSLFLSSPKFLEEQWSSYPKGSQSCRINDDSQPYALSQWNSKPEGPRFLISISSALVTTDTLKYRSSAGQLSSFFISTLLKHSFHNVNCIDYIDSITCPCIFIHSNKDELFPHDEVQSAIRSIKSEKLLVTTGGNHGRPIISIEEGMEIARFLRRHRILDTEGNQLCSLFDDMQEYRDP